VGLAKYFWGRWREGPGWPRADAGGRARCPGRRKPTANLGQEWVGPDASVRMRRTAEACETDASVRSNAFEHARMGCVRRLEMPLGSETCN
jgi:hypothetical protein